MFAWVNLANAANAFHAPFLERVAHQRIGGVGGQYHHTAVEQRAHHLVNAFLRVVLAIEFQHVFRKYRGLVWVRNDRLRALLALRPRGSEAFQSLVESLYGQADHVEVAAAQFLHGHQSYPFLNAIGSSLIERFVMLYIIIYLIL